MTEAKTQKPRSTRLDKNFTRDSTRHSDQMWVQPSRPITRLGVSSQYGDQADEKYRHLTITPPLLDHLIGAAEKYPFVARLQPSRSGDGAAAFGGISAADPARWRGGS